MRLIGRSRLRSVTAVSLRGNPRNFAEHRHFEFVLSARASWTERSRNSRPSAAAAPSTRPSDDRHGHDASAAAASIGASGRLAGIEHAEALAPLLARQVFGHARVAGSACSGRCSASSRARTHASATPAPARRSAPPRRGSGTRRSAAAPAGDDALQLADGAARQSRSCSFCR